jgi:UPF0755 protein
MFRLVKAFFTAAFLSLLIILGTAVFWFFVPPSHSSGNTTVEIPEQATFSHVVNSLAQHNVIRWPILMRIYGRLLEADKHVRAGIYEFPEGILPFEVMEKIMKGTLVLTEFSHPPGWNMWQVAEKLTTQFPHISKNDWLKAFHDRTLLKDIAPGAQNLEGYLFPDVYRIRSNAKASEVVRMMTANFKKNFTPEIVNRGKSLGLNPHQIVTLASIVEKETGASEERPLIAAVFFNRMKKSMRLQTDPTVIYGIWERFEGNLRRIDLETPTPYNTYTNAGLPPGPIANPGREALLAVVNPASTPFLYFVAKGDGTHYFSQTLTEHSNAVRRFQVLPNQKR